jgi:hypothetical protein
MVYAALLNPLWVATAAAGTEGHVRIKAPAEGAVFEGTSGIRLTYDASGSLFFFAPN